jgi:L,D-transpeptidase catalytic domain
VVGVATVAGVVGVVAALAVAPTVDAWSMPTRPDGASGTVSMGGAPPPPTMAPPDPSTCPSTSHGAVVDRANQRAWLCTDGKIVRVMAITSARDQPDPGIYPVYAEDLQSTSYTAGRTYYLDNFVAFTRGKYEGARVAFHAVPHLRDGTLLEPLEAVGTQALFGASSGCIRVRPADAVAVWNHLAVGDEVHVIS